MRVPFKKIISAICVCLLIWTTTSCRTVNKMDEYTESVIDTTTSMTTSSSHSTTMTHSTATTTTISTTAPITSTSTATSTTARSTTTSPSSHTTVQTQHKTKLIDAPIMAQMPNYPSGCESISAVMLLNYWGENISIDTFIDKHLPKSTNFYTKDGVFYGPSPYEYFIGNPRTTKSYGCMAPVIQRAIDNYLGENGSSKNVSGLSLTDLCKQFVDNDQPVLVWVTIGMVETYPGDSWQLTDGSVFFWPTNEHCMLLVGYDTSYYYFNDPYTGTLKKYARWICEDRYSDLGKQALTIVK